jgi:hypothetical protein
MTSGQDDERRFDAPDDASAPASPFRRLTPAGEPAWQSPPRPEPVDAFAAATPTISIPPEAPLVTEASTRSASGGSRTRWTAVIGLVGGILLLTAVAAGAYAAYQALLGHDDRATAEYVPANAWAYVAVNVDPTSHAWLDAWTLAKRAGIDDELSQLPKDGLAESGADPGIWESLIQPAVGRELGFAVWPDPAGVDEEPQVAAIVMIADEGKARDALETLLPGELRTETTYRDVTYETNDDGDAVGIVDEALILASSSEAFEAVVDAHADGALDGVAEFTAAADRAADNPLVFAYVDGASIAEAATALEDELPAGPDTLSILTPDLGSSFDVYADLDQITLTVKADDNALQTEVLTEGRPASFPMTPAGNPFADQMPASTLFYVASADLYGTIFAPAIGQYEEMLGTAGADGTLLMPTPDDLTAMLGVDAESGLLEQLNGPYALSVNVEEANGQYGGQFHFFSEVADPASVDDTLEDLVASLGVMAPVEPIEGGYRVEIPEEDLTLELTVLDDTLHLTGSYHATDASGTLADDAAFKAAMDSMPDNPTLSGYLATDRIWDLLPAEAWAEAGPDARGTLEAFGPLAFATAPDGDGTRTVFVMTVD